MHYLGSRYCSWFYSLDDLYNLSYTTQEVRDQYNVRSAQAHALAQTALALTPALDTRAPFHTEVCHSAVEKS